MVFVQDDGTLLAAPFDQDRLAVTGARFLYFTLNSPQSKIWVARVTGLNR